MLVALQFDPTISLGTIIQTLLGIVTLVATAFGVISQVRVQLGRFEQTLTQHAASIHQHSARMEKYEEQMSTVAGHLQRLIGRTEILDRFQRQQAPPY